MTAKSLFLGVWGILKKTAYIMAKITLFLLMAAISIIKFSFSIVILIFTLGAFATNAQYGSK